MPGRNNNDGLAGILHNGSHPKDYINSVNDIIINVDQVGGKQGVIDELSNIRNILSNAGRNDKWAEVLL